MASARAEDCRPGQAPAGSMEETMASKRMTKAAIVGELAEKTGVSKKEVASVFAGLVDIVKRELGKRGAGEFVIPDIVKLRVRETKAQKGKKFRNPATGEIVVRDVPASRKLRASPLKKLKDAVASGKK
jgi:nucleoid DNA-binding protein